MLLATLTETCGSSTTGIPQELSLKHVKQAHLQRNTKKFSSRMCRHDIYVAIKNKFFYFQVSSYKMFYRCYATLRSVAYGRSNIKTCLKHRFFLFTHSVVYPYSIFVTSVKHCKIQPTQTSMLINQHNSKEVNKQNKLSILLYVTTKEKRGIPFHAVLLVVSLRNQEKKHFFLRQDMQEKPTVTWQHHSKQ